MLALVLLLVAKLLSATITVSERGGKADTALYAMLNSNDCTPNTKLAFKDVLGIGIAEGKTKRTDKIDLDYSGAVEGVYIIDPSLPPVTLPLTIQFCISTFVDSRTLPSFFYFYVDMGASSTTTCPNKKCFETAILCPSNYKTSATCQVRDKPTDLSDTPLNIESIIYIALPNGEVAKVVLKTAS